METIWQDARYAVRLLRKQPGFSLVAILTLALGIGASTAIFSVIDAAILRPLPYAHPEQIVEIHVGVTLPNRPQPSYRAPSLTDVRRWQQPDSPFSSVAMWHTVLFDRVLDDAEPSRVEAIQVSEEYLTLLGLAPALGRAFNGGDMRDGAPAVAMLGYGYWKAHTGADPNVVGRVIRFDDRPTTIVGVMPARAEQIAVWVPLQVPPAQEARRGSGGTVYGRLRPGVTLDGAERQVSALVEDEPGPNGTTFDTTVRLTSLLEETIGDFATTTQVLSGAVALILLLACVNVAGLLLARGATRQAELAVRASIGAGRGRLLRQLLIESVVLSALGGALGVVVAWMSLDALVANIPMSLPSNSPATINLGVLGAAAAIALGSGVLFGLVPALRLSRVQIGAALARGNRRHGSTLSRRAGQSLIAAEIALAVVLVAGAGLMIRSFAHVLAVDMGFDPDAVVTLQVTPLDPDPASHGQFYPALLHAIRTLPGVAAAGAIDHLPLGGSSTFTMATVDGKQEGIEIRQILPGYFDALGVPVKQGHALSDAEYAASLPGAAINETAAREIFGSAPAVGRQITVNKRQYSIIGVAGDVRHGGPLQRAAGGGYRPSTPGAEIYVPFTPSTERMHQALALTVVVRPKGRVPDLASQLRRAAESVGPPVLVERVRTGADWMSDRVITPRRRTVLLGLLGALGLVLAVVGVFGMTAYSVSRRTQEIGVRMAFGARPAEMVRQMVRDSAVPIAIGTAVGLGGAALATRLIQTFLFETDPIDPATFALVSAVLVASGCLAAWVPARRAARVDPIAALRID